VTTKMTTCAFDLRIWLTTICGEERRVDGSIFAYHVSRACQIIPIKQEDVYCL
jgi:hypothetical protein